MDQLEVIREETREEVEQEQEEQQEGDASAEMMTTAPTDEVAATDSEAWRPPPGVFEFPWQKCRGGLGVPSGSATAELRDVFFRSLVDGRVAAVGVPGDRLLPVPSNRTLFDDVAAWLAAAGEGEVDPVWRSVLEGPRPAA
uniref:Uncharacterized protein n=2 Tax=Avena sativa TaxID=4498 RepID=A0ACD5ZSN1_AVESA